MTLPLIFIFGLLGACFALIIELIALDPGVLSGGMVFTFTLSGLVVLAALAFIEEVSKYLFLRQYLLRFFTNVSPNSRQVLTLGCFFGIGFASLEMLLVLNGQTDNSPLLGLMGVFSLHIATSLIIVFFLRHPEKRSFSSFLAPIALAVALHLLYNSILSFVL